MYDPANEHDACGVGFVVDIKGHRSHDIILKGIQILINLTHRGACGCDPETGDGAGILIQIPHKFFEKECRKLGFALPAPGEYAVGMMFLPVEPQPRLRSEGIVERIAREEGLNVLGWRDTPVNVDAIGRIARASQPYIEQLFLQRAAGMSEDQFERKLYVVRRRAENEIAASDIRDKGFFYVPSLSCRTIVYKGLLLAPQIADASSRASTSFSFARSRRPAGTTKCLRSSSITTTRWRAASRASPARTCSASSR
jgi:glutamate synthase domain-containing protein 1